MEALYRTFRLQLENTSTDFVRFLHDRIVWESRLIAILGARGVGKTTLLLQHIKLYDKVEETLFVTADDFYFSTHRLFDLALSFYNAEVNVSTLMKCINIRDGLPKSRTFMTRYLPCRWYIPVRLFSIWKKEEPI